MNSASLHDLVASALRGFQFHSHTDIGAALERLGLPPGTGTKRERLDQAVESLHEQDLARLAAQLLVEPLVSSPERFEIQDALWSGDNPPVIPARTRRELARSLDLDDLAYDRERFRATLCRWWLLGDDGLYEALNGLLGGGYSSLSLIGQIDQHVFRNRGDWSTEKLFSEIGAFDAVGTRFAFFLEDLVAARTVPDEPTQRRIVETTNPHLQRVGFELRETDSAEGYPVFTFAATGAARNQAPKTLIFASPEKPDLRFRDVLDNAIEILSDPSKVLAYDRPINQGSGLLWQDLQAWWHETRGSASAEAAKSELYKRLKASLPSPQISPPQHHLFDAYYEIHGPAVPVLPALLPEVWLYWDPKTAQQRGRDALLNFRMDFLLLLPNHQRVVIEVDGAHHYSHDGQASPRVYAKTMRGDRDLKLAGYEVFRFGAADLMDPTPARTLLKDFFADLFSRFGVSPASPR